MLEDVFEKLSGVPFVCKELGLNEKTDYQRVVSWRRRGRIPPKFRSKFLDLCKRYDVEVTLQQLAGVKK